MDAVVTPTTIDQTFSEPKTGLYAGFWRRVGAYFIDSLVVGIPLAIIFSAAGYKDNDAGPGLISALIGFLYFTLFESSKHQATPGKMALGIIVTDLNGHRISYQKAVIRWLSKIISGLLLMIGYIMVAFTAKKQGLHDKIAGTLVIRK